MAGKFRRRLLLVLCLGDHAQNSSRREHLFVQIPVPQDLLHDPLGIGGVIDGEAAAVAQALDLPPQDPAAGAVEGHGPHALALGAQKSGQTVLQLVGGLVGKGDGNDAPGVGRVQRTQAFCAPAVRRIGQLTLQKDHVLLGDILWDLLAVRAAAKTDEIGNTVNQHRGLAASRTCQQQQRPLGGQHCLKLPGIHIGKLPGDIFPPRSQKTFFIILCHSFSAFVVSLLHFSTFSFGNKAQVFLAAKFSSFFGKCKKLYLSFFNVFCYSNFV